jgi:hypothetical protein
MPEKKNNKDRIAQGGSVSVSRGGTLDARHTPLPLLFDNLSRLAGVSEAGARWRNPERSEGSLGL